ncbi:MAG: fibronectin type III domain-containing protein [Bryobacterales bacterium]
MMARSVRLPSSMSPLRSRPLLLFPFGALLALSFAAGSCDRRLVTEPLPNTAHQPSRMPDRVHLTWTGDPAHSQAVTWRTSADVPSAWAEIAVAEDGPLFVSKARRVEAVTEVFESDLGPAAYHTAEFEELSPDTLYVYRVGADESFSEWRQFRTVADTPAPLEFLYVGDAQNDVFSLWSRLIREGYSTAPRADFIIHAGDLINRANRDAEWGEWFLAAGGSSAVCPAFPRRGTTSTRRMT